MWCSPPPVRIDQATQKQGPFVTLPWLESFCMRKIWQLLDITTSGVLRLVSVLSTATWKVAEKLKPPQCAQDVFVVFQLWEFRCSSLLRSFYQKSYHINTYRKRKAKSLDELSLHIHTYPQHQLPNKCTHRVDTLGGEISWQLLKLNSPVTLWCLFARFVV